ncbi:uncharacterized protein LOC123884138 isoform X1 [Trifolium pratense]|uniref:uncharacterized protein LOC123884138 isoform X1 n=1 Tax=Trifolium pratense TaxID=57577 RepID=UPI001E691CA6|nr:uncharacterized protein LOC123884138 isoform X1 [Trifolium pratense]
MTTTPPPLEQQNLDEDTQMLDPISDVLVDQEMEQGEDRFSNLPKIILHKILSRLPQNDATMTSVLSKTWLEIWYTFPILSFSDTKVTGVVRQPVEDLPGKSKDFIEYVKSTLLRFSDQKLVIKEFNLRVDWFEVSSMSMDVDICLKLASENGVQVLELSNGRYKLEKDWGDCYVLPEKVIENQKLTKLSLVGGIRVDRAFTNHSIKFFSLRELYLLNVHFEDEQSIENLISCCPLIEIIILIFDRDGMESLRMDGLQKLKTVYTDGIKELYIDEVPSLESLYYCGHLDTPFKFDSIRCQNLKELFLILNRTTIITNKWFLELFQKFRFLERLKLLCCETSETINISSGQLKFLRLSFGSNLKEANIDAPNLSSCNIQYCFDCPKPIIFFSRFSSKLEVQIELSINSFDVCYVRELLQNIKPENILISLYISIYCPTLVAPNPTFLDISSPPPSIKHMNLRGMFPLTYETLASDFVVSLLLCCVPTNISLNLDACGRAFIEFLYETLMRKKEDDCFCGSSDTKCWWHNLKDVKINSYFKIDKINDVDFKTMLESFPTFRPRDISIRLEF